MDSTSIAQSLGMNVGLKVKPQRLAATSPPNAITNRFLDFWLLGGASIIFWIFIAVGQFWKTNWAVGHHFQGLPFVFTTLSVFVNYPHFIISYKFGYGRGMKFLRRNWFPLIFVPLLLLGAFALAYFSLAGVTNDEKWSNPLNHLLEMVNIPFQFGDTGQIGMEVLSLLVLLMYVTVGWHYSKQVFGCMMVYARFDKYPLGVGQKRLLKINLYSIAAINFIFGTKTAGKALGLFDIPSIYPVIPDSVFTAAYVAFAASLAVTIYAVLYRNRKRYGLFPSANFLISWLALILWWYPSFHITEYYMFAAPFFHSLQYLPFAYKIESGPKQRMSTQRGQIVFSLKILLLILISFLLFEGIPSSIDQFQDTHGRMDVWFFTAAAAIFINIHHFFIDSVVWKFSDPNLKERLFGARP